MPLPHSARLIAACALLSSWVTSPPPHAAEPDPAELSAPPSAPDDAPTAQPSPSPPGSAVDPRCAGAVVASVALRGCETSSCPEPEDVARFLSLTDLAVADTMSLDGLLIVRERLLATGLFRDARVTCEIDAANLIPGVVGVTVDVVPHTFVRRVRVEGNQFFRKADVLKRVFLRAGTVLDVDPGRPHANEQVQRQIESLDRLYRDAGLDNASFRVVVHPISETGVDLTIHIEEGVRARIASVNARHIHTPGATPDDLACPTIPQRRLERLVDVELGDVVTSKLHREVRERLRRAFQAVGFVRPRVLGLDGEGDPSKLDIVVETDRCWIIRVWERESASGGALPEPAFRFRDPVGEPPASGGGEAPYTRADLDEWLALLPFAESGVYDRDEAARGVGAIQASLRASGHPFAVVTMQHRDLRMRGGRRDLVDAAPGDGRPDVRGVIDYMITRNHERRVREIALLGNATFDDETLTALFQTRVYDFFDAVGFFDEERFFDDLAEMTRYYRDRGFYDFALAVRGEHGDEVPARVQLPPPSASGDVAPEDDWIVWRHTFGELGFLLKKRRSELGLYLEVHISEGPRTRVADFAVAGHTQLSQAEIERVTGLGPGSPFGPALVERAVEGLTRWYRERGYHQARIELFCEAHASKSGDAGFCDPQRPVRADRVDVGLRIVEGPQVFVGEVFWRGTFETDPHVLLRDLPAAGTPLDLAKIDAAVRKMRALGLFNSVRVDLIGLDETPPRDRVAIVLAVEETGYRFIDVALGLRSIQRADLERVPTLVASASGNLVNTVDRATTGFGRAFPLDIPDLLVMLELEYLDLNAFGLGHQLRLPMAAGFSFSQFLRLASFNPTYVWPRLFDGEIRLEARAIAELDRVTDPLDRLELGVELDFALPLSPRMLMGLTLRPSVLKLAQPTDACLFCLEEGDLGFGTALADKLAGAVSDPVACDDPEAFPGACEERDFEGQLRVSVRWRWDERDNPLHPTRGFELSASSTFIVGKVGFDTSAIEDAFFLKWEAAARLAVDLKLFVLALYARYGGSYSFGDVAFLPSIERYTLGGSNGLRGFADNAVCRYDERGDLDPTCPRQFGGNVVINGNLEARVPVVRNVGLWLAAFLDVGALAEDHDSVHLASFRTGAGVGVRWLIGGQLPVRLDVGFPLERRCVALAEDGERCAVIEDVNVVHLEFLYPF